MRKEFRLLLMSFVLVFAFASCDDKDDDEKEVVEKEILDEENIEENIEETPITKIKSMNII